MVFSQILKVFLVILVCPVHRVYLAHKDLWVPLVSREIEDIREKRESRDLQDCMAKEAFLDCVDSKERKANLAILAYLDQKDIAD